HQDLGFQDCRIAQGQMHSHLVTVKVGVERGTHQRVQLDGLTFYQRRLESLDTQTVQCRRTVKEYRMTFQYVFQYIPYDRIFAVDDFLRGFNGLNDTPLNHLAN